MDYIKTYTRGDVYQYKFTTGIFDNENFDFDIVDTQPLEHGFESSSPDQQDSVMYPSNLEFTIDDFSGGNYIKFKKLLDRYNVFYPYNFSDVLVLTVSKNNVEIFTGVLYMCEYNMDYSQPDQYIKLTWVSGCNFLKDLQFGNYYILEKLYQIGAIQRTEVRRDTDNLFYGWVYGYDIARVQHLIGNIHDTLVYERPHTTPFDVVTFIKQMFQFINPNVNLDINHNWQMSTDGTHYDKVLTDINYRGIETYITGRYFVKIESQFVKFDANTWVRQQDSIVNGTLYSVWYEHNGNLDHNNNPYDEGVPDKKLNSALKFLTAEFNCICGMISYTKAFLRKRYFTNPNPVELPGAYTINKTTFLRAKQYVKIHDDFLNVNAIQGVYLYGLSESLQLQYSIGGQIFAAGFLITSVKDTGMNNYRNTVREVVAMLEWQTRHKTRDKYTIDVEGTDIDFLKDYKINDEGTFVTVRPIKLQIDTVNNVSKIEAMEVAEYEAL